MNAFAFDTLRYSKLLQQAGVVPEQADAHAEALAQTLVEPVSQQVMTKQDGEQLEARLTQEIRTVRTELRTEMQLLEQRMTIKLGSMLVLATGAMAALNKLL